MANTWNKVLDGLGVITDTMDKEFKLALFGERDNTVVN
jgi:hypothetical protein